MMFSQANLLFPQEKSLGIGYSSETLALVVVPSIPEFLRDAGESDSVKSMLSLPGAALVIHLAEKAGEHESLHGALEFGETPAELFERLSELLPGRLELSFSQTNGTPEFTLLADVNANDALMEPLEELLSNPEFLNQVGLEELVLANKRSVLSHKSSGYIFEYHNDRFSLYSNQMAAEKADKWEQSVPKKSLADRRIFRLLERRCKFDKVSAWFYVDVDRVLGQTIQGHRQKAELPDGISVEEILAFGGVFNFGDTRQAGSTDFDVNIHVAQAIPRTGINNILRFAPLSQGVGEDIPADMDVSFRANLDLTSLAAGIKFLDAYLADDFGRKAVGTRALTNIFPLLGASVGLDRELLADCKGDFELVGKFLDTAGGTAFPSLTRLHLESARGPQIINRIAKPGIDDGELENKQLFGIPCVTWTKEFEQQHLQQIEQMKQRYPDLSLPSVGRQILFANGRHIGLSGDELLLGRIIEGSESRLVDVPGYQKAWKLHSKKSAPDAFAYFSPGTFFRSVFQKNQSMINPFFYQRQLQELRRNEAKMDSIRFQFHSILNRQLNKIKPLPYSDFKNSLGPSSISIVETPHGINIRIVQHRPKE